MRLATTDVFKKLHRNNDTLYILSDEEVKAAQNVGLESLEDILDICNAYEINYHLTGGSALGVVRHQGFIPWDDDIDIDMARKDIQRFLTEFQRKYGDKYWIHTPASEGTYCIPYVNIRRKGTIFQGCADPSPEECGICIDILPMENTFDNKALRTVHGAVSMALGLIVSCRRFYMNRDYMLRLAGDDEESVSVFKTKIRLGWLFSFLSLERWVRMYDGWNALCHNENSRYVTVAAGREKYFKGTYPRSVLAETTEGLFEGRVVKIPKEADAYLTHMYGDYMQIPPKENQERHALVAFEIHVGN